MQFYSTNKDSPLASLQDAVLAGLAPDGGLFMPEEIPTLSGDSLKHLSTLSFQDIAFEITQSFFGQDIPEDDVRQIVGETLTFDAPLVQLSDNVFILELFHGPTLAFKDFGARFMARLMSSFARGSDRELTILVATAGDTGSAVASGFYDMPNIRVIILYPSGKVSHLQEKQLTTMGGNITALEVEGSFDDCQRLVKQAFLDDVLKGQLHLTSANSINIARLIPQSFYYFYAYAQLKDKEREIVFSIPSGNLGNLTAGLMAKRMGLPITKFVAATNVNDVFGEYLKTGTFSPRPSKETISNAMDVGNPSNFARIGELYDYDVEKMREDIWHARVTDHDTRQIIRSVFKKYHYTLDPHGAVSYLGLEEYLDRHPISQGVSLETAHPAKFREEVEEATGQRLEIPRRLKQYMPRTKQSIIQPSDYRSLRDFLMNLST